MQIALKETAETEYWLNLLFLSDYPDEKLWQSLINDCLEIKRILIASLKTAKASKCFCSSSHRDFFPKNLLVLIEPETCEDEPDAARFKFVFAPETKYRGRFSACRGIFILILIYDAINDHMIKTADRNRAFAILLIPATCSSNMPEQKVKSIFGGNVVLFTREAVTCAFDELILAVGVEISRGTSNTR